MSRRQHENTAATRTVVPGPEHVRCREEDSETVCCRPDAHDCHIRRRSVPRILRSRRLAKADARPRAPRAPSVATTLSLDAVRSPNAMAPAHLHDAHLAMSTTGSGGPMPRTAATRSYRDSVRRLGWQVHHPAADAPTVHVHAHLCTDDHPVGDVRRDRVDELLVECRQIGHDERISRPQGLHGRRGVPAV